MKRPKTIFIFAYYAYKDPVFQSAVLPYFLGLSKDNSLRFVLLTFEHQRYPLEHQEIKAIQEQLNQHHIHWFQSYWHSGSFKLLKKAYDFLYSLAYASLLIWKNKASVIYSEGFPGAIIGHLLSRLWRIPHIVHTYEPHTQYMVEAGVWSKQSWEARLLSRFEKQIGLNAEYILTATDLMIEKLKGQGAKGSLYRVPSCVDLNLFRYADEDRNQIRQQLGISMDDKVIIYLGKFGGMYFEHEVIHFFKTIQNNSQYSWRFIILTPDDHGQIHDWLRQYGLREQYVYISKVSKEEVPAYLSAADFGYVPVRQHPGKRYCSPIKDGEYWACGLPILIYKGVSDDYLMAEENQIGIVIHEDSEKEYRKFAHRLDHWIEKEDKLVVGKRCRKFVEKDRDVGRYQSLFKNIFHKI
jgi:hypothetical protein